MKKMLDFIKKNKTLKELMAGILIVGVLMEIPVFLISDRVLYSSLGLLVGTISSLVCAIYMAYSIDVAVMLDEKSSIAYMRKGTVYRYLFLCVVLIVTGVSNIASPVTLIFGFLTLKFGAYINPLIHRFFN